jgi:hypothetical protein
MSDLSELDRLMNEDPLNLSAQDIDAIIAYHRSLRARRASGEKSTKPTADISDIMTKLIGESKPAVTITRRLK